MIYVRLGIGTAISPSSCLASFALSLCLVFVPRLHASSTTPNPIIRAQAAIPLLLIPLILFLLSHFGHHHTIPRSETIQRLCTAALTTCKPDGHSSTQPLLFPLHLARLCITASPHPFVSLFGSLEIPLPLYSTLNSTQHRLLAVSHGPNGAASSTLSLLGVRQTDRLQASFARDSPGLTTAAPPISLDQLPPAGLQADLIRLRPAPSHGAG